MVINKLLPLAWIALGIAFTTGTAVAATGSALVLGRPNSTAGTTSLTSSNATPLSIRGPNNAAPLSIGVNQTVVPHLNSDLLDGLHASAFQRKLSGRCLPGEVVAGINGQGTVVCRPVPTQWFAVVAADGSLSNGTEGVDSGRYLKGAGSYYVQVPAHVSGCAWTATPAGQGTATVGSIAAHDDYVAVSTFSGSTASDLPFNLLVTCS
jgi:hypothetical protein